MNLLGSPTGTLKDSSGRTFKFDDSSFRIHSVDLEGYDSPEPYGKQGFAQIDLPTISGRMNVAKIDFRNTTGDLLVELDRMDLNSKFDRAKVASAVVKYLVETLKHPAFRLTWRLNAYEAFLTRLLVDMDDPRFQVLRQPSFTPPKFVLDLSRDSEEFQIYPIVLSLTEMGYQLDNVRLEMTKNAEEKPTSIDLVVTMSKDTTIS